MIPWSVCIVKLPCSNDIGAVLSMPLVLSAWVFFEYRYFGDVLRLLLRACTLLVLLLAVDPRAVACSGKVAAHIVLLFSTAN